MSEAVPFSSCVLPDNFTEADVLAQPGDIMLVNAPPDEVEEISRYLMSSLQQHSGQDANSDSGDSLFITQKCAPQRQRRSNRRSNFRDSPEDEYDASTSEEEHLEDRKQKKKSCRTPKFTFPFLKERMMTRLPYYQNRKLHYYAMGGYFRCVEQLWDSYQTGEGLQASLPTADKDGEPISPMSEKEDETTENEDIRVAEKKLFVVSKRKNPQPWYSPRKRSSEETQHNEEHDNAEREPQGGRGRMTCKISVWTLSSRAASSSKTKESDEVMEETESVDERVSTSGNLPAETEMGKSRSPGKESRASGFIPEENGQMLGNENDPTFRSLSAEQSDREATDPHTGADEQTGVQDNDIECRIIKVKKRKTKKKEGEDDKCVEEGKDQSLEGAGGHQTDPSSNLIITEALEAPCMEKKTKNNKKKREEEETWTPSLRGVSSSKSKESDEVSEETESVGERGSTSGNLPAETEMGKKSRFPGKESRAIRFIPEENGQMLGKENNATFWGPSAEQSDREATDPHNGADEQTGVQDNDIECRIIKVKKRKKKNKEGEDDKSVEEGKDQSLEGTGGHQTDPSSNLIITDAVEAPGMEKKKKKKKKCEKEETWTPSLSGAASSSKTKESDEVLEETESVNKRVSTSGNLPAETEMGKSRFPGKESRASGFIYEENESNATFWSLSAEQSDREATDPHTGADEQTGVQDNDIECRIIKVKKRKKKKKEGEDDKSVEEGKDQSLEGAGGHQTDPSSNLIITEAVEAPCMEKKKKKKKKREKEETWTPSLSGASFSKSKESKEVSEETESVNERVSSSGNLPAETEMGKKSRFPGKESRANGFIPEENGQMLGNENDPTIRSLSAEQSHREATDPHTGADEQTGVQDNDIECRIIKVKKRKKKKKGGEDDKCVEEGKDQSVEGAGGHQTDPSSNLIITEAVEAPCMEKKKKKKKKREKEETWTPSLRGVSSSKTNESDEVSEETESVNERVSTSGKLPAETEMGKKSRFPGKESRAIRFIPEENESDATCRGTSAEQSDRNDRDAIDPHTRADEQTSVRNNDIESRIIKVKKRKKKKKEGEDDKCVEEGKDQSLEGAGGHQTDPSSNLIVTEAVEAPCMKKKKKKKKKCENQDLVQEADEQSDQRKEEDFVVVCETGIGDKEGNIETDSLKTNKAAESATNYVHVPKKRKKKDSSYLDQATIEHPKAIDHSVNVEAFQETLESSGFKRKKHKKKKSQLHNDNQTDMHLSNDASTVPENTDFVYKKKKKKHVSDQIGLVEGDESVEKTQKEKRDIEPETKKKKNMKDDISVRNSEDMLASGDYSELVRKKKRTPSVLSADDEEQSPSAHEGRAEKPEVSTGELAAESANVFEHLQESKDGKKKKKRSATVPESEERKLVETTEPLVKNKEKRKRTERLTESLESVEQSQTEEALVVKKKKRKKSRQEVPDEENH